MTDKIEDLIRDHFRGMKAIWAVDDVSQIKLPYRQAVAETIDAYENALEEGEFKTAESDTEVEEMSVVWLNEWYNGYAEGDSETDDMGEDEEAALELYSSSINDAVISGLREAVYAAATNPNTATFIDVSTMYVWTNVYSNFGRTPFRYKDSNIMCLSSFWHEYLTSTTMTRQIIDAIHSALKHRELIKKEAERER